MIETDTLTIPVPEAIQSPQLESLDIYSDPLREVTQTTALESATVWTSLEEAVQVVLLDSVEMGVQGPPGPTGASGDVSLLSFTAGADLGGHRIVVLDGDQAIYADQTIPDHAERVIGITIGAAEAGTLVMIQTGGDLTEPSWNWDVTRPIYLATQGLLTQTPPTTGFIQQVAIPLSPTRLRVVITSAFFLE